MEKNYKILKWLLHGLISFVFLFVIMIVFSPYGSDKNFSYKTITQSIEINAASEKVFTFLGNSNNASKWSSFVNHITVLNINSSSDGHEGSRRRCFQNKNEKGKQWDELITRVYSNKERELTIYNLKNFPMTVENLATKQLYINTGDKKCRLTFVVFFKNDNPTIFESIKLYVAAYQISPIFKKNLQNIKKIIELDHNE